MSATSATAHPKPEAAIAAAASPPTQRLPSAATAMEPIKNTSEHKPSESEPPAVKSSKTRLEKLLEERRAIDQRIKQQLQKEAHAQRQRETRQKILIGAAVQKQISQGTLSQDWLLAVLDAALTLERDRKLFDLPPLPETMPPPKGAG